MPITRCMSTKKLILCHTSCLDTVLPLTLRTSTRKNAIFMVYINKLYHFYVIYQQKLPVLCRRWTKFAIFMFYIDTFLPLLCFKLTNIGFFCRMYKKITSTWRSKEFWRRILPDLRIWVGIYSEIREILINYK